MIVDLNPMPFTKAIYLIRWCHARGIDKDNCERLLGAMRKVPVPDDYEWSINVPDKYMTWIEMESA